MKRLLVAALLVVSLVACGSSDGDGGDSLAVDPPAQEGPLPKVDGVADPVVLDLPNDNDDHSWPDVLLFCRGKDLYAVTEMWGQYVDGLAGGGIAIKANGCPDGVVPAA